MTEPDYLQYAEDEIMELRWRLNRLAHEMREVQKRRDTGLLIAAVGISSAVAIWAASWERSLDSLDSLGAYYLFAFVVGVGGAVRYFATPDYQLTNEEHEFLPQQYDLSPADDPDVVRRYGTHFRRSRRAHMSRGAGRTDDIRLVNYGALYDEQIERKSIADRLNVLEEAVFG